MLVFSGPPNAAHCAFVAQALQEGCGLFETQRGAHSRRPLLLHGSAPAATAMAAAAAAAASTHRRARSSGWCRVSAASLLLMLLLLLLIHRLHCIIFIQQNSGETFLDVSKNGNKMILDCCA
jgi:hypothetical protein